MRQLIILWALTVLFGCDANEVPLSEDCRDLTAYLSMEEFEAIKDHILDHGGREIIFNKYLENPYYAFEGFNAFLIPEVGHRNSNSDPAVSDFNQIIVQKLTPAYVYYLILAVRKGDLENEEIEFEFLDGMKEKRTYLVKYHEYDLDEMEEEVIGFITEMKTETGI